jgi:hypothetical protein
MSWYPSDPTGKCVRQNSANFDYEDFFCLYENSIGWTMTPIEKNYNPIYVRDWMRDNPWIPIVAILGYGAMIGIGKTYFAKRDAWSWRTTLAAWNLLLSVFSFVGFCRVAPGLAHNLYTYSISENLCFDPEQLFGSDQMVGTWVQLFILSKFPYVYTFIYFCCIETKRNETKRNKTSKIISKIESFHSFVVGSKLNKTTIEGDG